MPREVRSELSRNLGLFDVTMVGISAMIGAGIFVLTGIAAGAAGPSLILSFSLNGIIALFTAMIYAELGSALPSTGGGYLFVREGLPGGSAFIAGWMSWFAISVAGSLYALGFGAYSYMVLSTFNIPFFGIEPEIMKKGLAIFITDHNVRETLAVCDFAYIVNNGRILTSGAADDIVNSDEARRMYLGQDFSL